MKVFHKLAASALLAGTAAIGASTPAAAHVDVSIGIGGPGVFVGDYDYYRPCSWYHYYGIPAPYRCYRDFYGFYGPNVYVVDGFVFRDHDDWYRWHDRDDWNHWRVHEFRRTDWHDNGEHRGWYKHDHDDRGDRDWRDHDNGRGHDHDWHDHDHGDHGHGDHGDHDHDH
jgi:hypothetical protein